MRQGPRRRLDRASLALLLIGLICGALALWLTAAQRVSALIVIPAVVATITGATHLTKLEA